MARLLENLISVNPSLIKIRKIKERNFTVEDKFQNLSSVEDVLYAVIAQYESEEQGLIWLTLKPYDPNTYVEGEIAYLVEKATIINPETSEVQEYNIATPLSLDQYSSEEILSQSYVRVPSEALVFTENPSKAFSGVETGTFQEKPNLYLPERATNIHYYPLTSFTDFYVLKDVEKFSPYSSQKSVDTYKGCFSTKRHLALADDPGAPVSYDAFWNKVTPSDFLAYPFFSPKGASSTKKIENLIYFKSQDLKYVNENDRENYRNGSPWESCWSGNCKVSYLPYNYSLSPDGTRIEEKEEGSATDIQYQYAFTPQDTGKYCFSFYIKLDDYKAGETESFNTDRPFTSNFITGFFNNSTSKFETGEFFLDEDSEEIESNTFKIGEAWTRVTIVSTLTANTLYTVKIIWPYRSNLNGLFADNRRRIYKGENYYFKCRFSGLLLEKGSYPSIYDPECLCYLDPNYTIDESTESYERLLPFKGDSVSLLIIGENNTGDVTGQISDLALKSFNTSTYTIIYRRYLEGKDVIDNIGASCTLGYENGIPFVKVNGVRVEGTTKNNIPVEDLVRFGIWETIVFKYMNTSSEETVEIYYPEDTEPRFSWSFNLSNGNLQPKNILTSFAVEIFNPFYVHAYLLLGADVTEGDAANRLTSQVLATYPAYYRDLMILKDQDAADLDFRQVLRKSLFRLKLTRRQGYEEDGEPFQEDLDVALFSDSFKEGSYTLNKAYSL